MENKFMDSVAVIEFDKDGEIKGMDARDLYNVLCKDLSFNTMIELYKLLQFKMIFF